ncbi:hypothetical protein JW977_00570 [Candidatus Falkowbacteria bacterium]|nr:hypothetical protein [Candidatus Falkowbacteria bacterium]
MANKDANIKKIQEMKKEEIRPEAVEVPVRVEVTPSPEIPKPIEAPVEKAEEGMVAPELPSAPVVTVPAALPKSPVLEEIEDVLEEDLQDIYFQLPPEKQAEFAQRGEETATKIELLLGQVKVKVNKILELIKKWLKLIPGVNKYFLEQEAKIKTDKILRIKEEGEQSDSKQNKT